MSSKKTCGWNHFPLVETPSSSWNPFPLFGPPPSSWNPFPLVGTPSLQLQPLPLVGTPSLQLQPLPLVGTPSLQLQPPPSSQNPFPLVATISLYLQPPYLFILTSLYKDYLFYGLIMPPYKIGKLWAPLLRVTKSWCTPISHPKVMISEWPLKYQLYFVLGVFRKLSALKCLLCQLNVTLRIQQNV